MWTSISIEFQLLGQAGLLLMAFMIGTTHRSTKEQSPGPLKSLFALTGSLVAGCVGRDECGRDYWFHVECFVHRSLLSGTGFSASLDHAVVLLKKAFTLQPS